MNFTKRILIAVLLTLTALHADEIRSGDALVRAMHDRYAKSWYRGVTFKQATTTYDADQKKMVQTWYEALSCPGKLRVDIDPIKDGNGFLLADGTMTAFHEGEATTSRQLVNLLLLLGFDVYCQSPETTLATLKDEGVDLSKFHQDTWLGRPVYVVGAAKDDVNSKQFWVDKDRLLFVRLFQAARDDPKKVQDVRFTDYRELAGAWIAARVEVYANERLVLTEVYDNIEANPKLDPAVFDPKQYSAAHWEKP